MKSRQQRAPAGMTLGGSKQSCGRDPSADPEILERYQPGVGAAAIADRGALNPAGRDGGSAAVS